MAIFLDRMWISEDKQRAVLIGAIMMVKTEDGDKYLPIAVTASEDEANGFLASEDFQIDPGDTIAIVYQEDDDGDNE